MLQLVILIIVVLLIIGAISTGDIMVFFRSIITAIVSVVMAFVNLIT